jgi:tripartite-type tricarboxylate transporter receptor subunit TctC
MKNLIKAVLVICSLLILYPFWSEIQAAEEFPAKPITFIVPLEAGAGGDILSRFLIQKASTFSGTQIMVVNKPGAGSSIGYREIYGARPNGYTIGMSTVTIVTNKLQGLMPLDYHDFSLLGSFYTMPVCIFASTKTKRPFKTIEEAMTFAKAHPGEVSLAVAGVGQSDWIGAMAFITGTGINLNVIPQPGAGAFAVTQLAGGHADLGITNLAAAKPQMEAGNLRFVGVIGPERAREYKSVPTLKDLGYDITWESTGNVIGPPNMPKDITDKLTKAFEAAANDPEFQKFLLERFATPFYLPPEKVVSHLDGQRKVAQNIMGKAGILKEK